LSQHTHSTACAEDRMATTLEDYWMKAKILSTQT